MYHSVNVYTVHIVNYNYIGNKRQQRSIMHELKMKLKVLLTL